MAPLKEVSREAEPFSYDGLKIGCPSILLLLIIILIDIHSKMMEKVEYLHRLVPFPCDDALIRLLLPVTIDGRTEGLELD
jgi:hypothetical protein